MQSADSNFHLINCPVCNATEHKQLFSIMHKQSNVLKLLQIQDQDRPAAIVQCFECSHQYMTPVISDELMTRYYSIINSEFYDTSNAVPININKQEYDDYTADISALKKTGKVLEIGCGNGFLLKRLEAEGYDCYGVEPSPIAWDHAKNKLGLKVENCFLSASSYYRQQFDIVILIDVVEHIADMDTFMKEVCSVMNEDGLIFIGTGNIGSLNARIAGPDWGYFVSWEHLSFFNEKSMQFLMDKHGFQQVLIHKTSLQHRLLQNSLEFLKGLAKKVLNPFLKNRYYHGTCFDHFIVTAKYKRS